MSSSTLTAVRNVDQLRIISGNIFDSERTLTITTGTLTVTVTQGDYITLAGLTLPSSFGDNSVSVSSYTNNTSYYVFTCTNNLSSTDTSLSYSFTVTASVTMRNLRRTVVETKFHDPTMLFKPPG